jgi:hypothetical protein
MPSYTSARQKLERAKHHVRDLTRIIANIPREKYDIVIDRESDPKQTLIKVLTKPLDGIEAMVFGDAVNNCRQALDHAFATAIGAENDITGQVFFPIRDNRDGLIGSLQKGAKKHPIPKPLWDVIVDDIQPYDGGHPTIPALNKLANLDKHRSIITLLGTTAITADFNIGTNIMRNITAAADAGQEINAFTLPHNFELQGDFKLSLEIRIGETQIPAFSGKAAVPALLSVANDIAIVHQQDRTRLPLA